MESGREAQKEGKERKLLAGGWFGLAGRVRDGKNGDEMIRTEEMAK
jgi:hypothetical protein